MTASKSEIDELMKHVKPSMFVAPKREPKTMTCPDCGKKMYSAECCTIDNEWLFVCRDCKQTWTMQELVEMAMDRIDAAETEAHDGE